MTNAKFYRNLVCAGLGALALSHVPLSHAYYTQATPPLGFTAGAINTFNGAKAGVTASLELGRITANASLNVGGRAIALASRTSLAANAARVAALAIYANPAVRIGLGVATLVGATGFLYNATKGIWEQADPSAEVSTGFEYVASGGTGAGVGSTPEIACKGLPPFLNDGGAAGWTFVRASESACILMRNSSGSNVDFSIRKRPSSCPVGWYKTPAGCVQSVPSVPVTQEQFAERLIKHPMPPNILPELPFDLPVDVPYIEPLFVPTGNPVKNPNYDPSKPQTGENQPYVQPGVKVEPANDVKNPFQVNVQPVDRPVASPEAKPDPVPENNPDGTPKPDQGDKPKEDKDERDLCEKNPDILACQKIDTDVDNEQIPKSQQSVSYQAESIWGGGSCPADRYTRIGGQEMKVVDWSRDCQFVTDYVKPVALAITSLIVAGILAGALKP